MTNAKMARVNGSGRIEGVARLKGITYTNKLARGVLRKQVHIEEY